MASSGNVAYTNANSQTTIGIWGDMGRHGMTKIADNIKPEILYGKKLGDLAAQGQHRLIGGEVQNGACQGKFIDNRLEYWYYNGIYDMRHGDKNSKRYQY